MANFIIRFLGGSSCTEKELRKRCGVFCGILGITVNVLLFMAKLYAGTVSDSIAIRADAFNNLSDAASCGITVFAFVLSSRPADREHPFGHGRVEYICSMAVTFMIFLMSYELASSSLKEILNPQEMVFGYVSAVILAVSVVGKLFLAYLNGILGKKIASTAISAAATDSLADAAATFFTLTSLLISKYFFVNIDGYLGLAAAVFIFTAGIRLFKESSGPLLGKPPEKEFIREVTDKILSYEGVEGIHDLIVHDYGSGKRFGTVHVETDSECDAFEVHDTLDLIEQDIFRETGMHLVIHHDPLSVRDERVRELKALTTDIVGKIDPVFELHDFRVAESPLCTNLIFDLVIPFGCKYSENEISGMINEKLHAVSGDYFAIISVEHSYI